MYCGGIFGCPRSFSQVDGAGLYDSLYVVKNGESVRNIVTTRCI